MINFKDYFDIIKDLLKEMYGIEFTKTTYTLNHLNQLSHITGVIQVQKLSDDDGLNLCRSESLNLRLLFLERETEETATYDLLNILEDLKSNILDKQSMFSSLNNSVRSVDYVDNGFQDTLFKNNLIHSAWLDIKINFKL